MSWLYTALINTKKAQRNAGLFYITSSVIYLRPRAIFAREISPSLSMKYNQPDSR